MPKNASTHVETGGNRNRGDAAIIATVLSSNHPGNSDF